MAEVVLTRRALKDIEKLDEGTKRRILEKLEEYSARPLEGAIKLTDPRLGTYRYRVGDYRIIFDLEEGRVVVLRIGNRREIYR